MKTILKFLTLAAVAVSALVQTADAQLQPATTTTILVNNGVVSNTPVGVLTIDVRRQRNLAVKWSFELGGAGTEVMGLRFQPSVDGSTIATTPAQLGYYLAASANGATTVNVNTNFDTLGYPYMTCYYITNGNATFFLTNRISWWVLPAQAAK